MGNTTGRQRKDKGKTKEIHRKNERKTKEKKCNSKNKGKHKEYTKEIRWKIIGNTTGLQRKCKGNPGFPWNWYWISVKSIPGRAFYFETYLPEYGALYDKLPISAFVSRPETPCPDLNLPNLQFWNCMDYGVRVIEKQYVASMDWECKTRDHGVMSGEYVFTLDTSTQTQTLLTIALVRTHRNTSHTMLLS